MTAESLPAPGAASPYEASESSGTSDRIDDTSRESADPHCMSDEEADTLLREAPWRRLAIVGDSLAEGLGDPVPGYRTVCWADRVAEALRRSVPDLAYLNLGRRGLTATEVRAEQAEHAAAFAPDLLGVVCGGNDLLLPGFSPDVLAAELDDLFDALAARRTTLFVFALANVVDAVPELRGGPLERGVHVLNEVTREVAARHGAVVVRMYGHPASSDRDLFSADRLHASARGHAVIAATTIRTLASRIPAAGLSTGGR
ncbi:Lysophospholipase L1 [Actinacidiphila yanglinensis]|uniref:Lysophospholipase L1 n=1 Tax=Actinacidiphila yanglinensis TaxID=310779 RepID=A0A1H6BBX3_9ACTN|nr:SGNH/GDSL hydrolase family protein [Actinacidiphila yanglinensis]SEG58248.1 Lysophospholipase L1 [Actinacidiphila yanglinensis]